MTMTVYDELVARGLVAQVTDEDELKELINAGKIIRPAYMSVQPHRDYIELNER